MFEETDCQTLEGTAFDAEWEAFMADMFDLEPESNGWEG